MKTKTTIADQMFEIAAAARHLLYEFEQSHEWEIQNDHEGDGPTGCSYCEAIARMKKALGDETK